MMIFILYQIGILLSSSPNTYIQILGETGTVQDILDSGDVRVRYSQSVMWTIGAEALVKVIGYRE